MVVTSEGDNLYLEDSFLDTETAQARTPGYSGKNEAGYKGTLKSVLAKVEEDYIKQVMEQCGTGVGSGQALGIHRSVLYRKMEKFLP
jgi:DNA-binding NtrC family response regulator